MEEAPDAKQDLPIVAFPSSKEWEAWLAANHATSKGVWLQFAKKGTGIPTVTYEEALQSALCYGWIDGQVAKYDERYYLQRFPPRTRKSKWSRLNRERVLARQRRGRMQPAGLAKVEQAQQDGRWDAAYEPPSRITVPQDLQRALDDNPAALA